MSSPPDAPDVPAEEEEGDDLPYDEEVEFATEHERRFAILDYLLNRLEQEAHLEELYALAERLNEAEEETIPAYEEFEGRALAFLTEGRSPDEMSRLGLAEGGAEGHLEGLRRRLMFFYLLAVVDEDAEAREQAFELAGHFNAQGPTDFIAACETLDANLTHHEDLFMADYLEMTEDADGEGDDQEHDHGGEGIPDTAEQPWPEKKDE